MAASEGAYDEVETPRSGQLPCERSRGSRSGRTGQSQWPTARSQARGFPLPRWLRAARRCCRLAPRFPPHLAQPALSRGSALATDLDACLRERVNAQTQKPACALPTEVYTPEAAVQRGEVHDVQIDGFDGLSKELRARSKEWSTR
jgi:hypothetical protein